MKGPDECWEWAGGILSTGYGEIQDGDRNRKAHRIAWELFYGPIPNGMCVLHRCDNSACVNSRHLFLGSQADNMRDMDKKGRRVVGLRGESNLQAKLTEQKVRGIRVSRLTQRELGKKHGVSQVAIGMIKRGKSWGWLK